MSEQPLSEWQCQVCGFINGHGMAAIPSNCGKCGLSHTARAYPAFDMKLGRVVYGPISPPSPAETPLDRQRRDLSPIQLYATQITAVCPHGCPINATSFCTLCSVNPATAPVWPTETQTATLDSDYLQRNIRTVELANAVARFLGLNPADEIPFEELTRRLQSGPPRAAQPATTEPIRYDQTPSGCWVACIAGLTRLPRDDFERMVPRFTDGSLDGSMGTEYHNAVNAYLRAHGWRLAHIGSDAPRGYSVASGMSPRGIEHATIALDGALWHDPHESRAGVVGGFTMFEILVPLAAPVADAWDSLRSFAAPCYEYAKACGVADKFASTPSPTTPSAPTIRHDVRFDEGQVEPDGTIDEVVGTGIYHAEMMNDNTLWMQLGDDAFHVTSRGERLRFTRWGPAGDMARAVRATSPDPRTSPPEPKS